MNYTINKEKEIQYMLTPDTINDIERDIDKDNYEALVSSIENLKITLDDYKTKLPDLFNRIEETVQKLESSAIKIDKVSAFFSDKTQVAWDTLFSGITDGLDELVSDITVRFGDSFDNYDRYITEIKKTSQEINENTTYTRRFKKWYDTGNLNSR